MTSSARSSQPAPSPLAQRATSAFSCLVEQPGPLGVAVSGGSDSLALLVLANDYCRTRGLPCLAVTVDHGLRPESADEAAFVARACAGLGIAHSTLIWRRDAAAAPVSQAAARMARHRMLATWAVERGISQFAIGHTRDDRLETFLMRARQGSGWHGLAGLMPNSCSPVWPGGGGVFLIRPLLPFGREELRADLRARGLAWIEDPSNAAERFERVRMRRLIGRLDTGARDSLLRVMNRLCEMRTAVMRAAGALLAQVRISPDGREASLALTAGRGVGREAWRRFIEAEVMAAGGAELRPRREGLDRLLRSIEDGAPELVRGMTLAGAKIRVRKGGLLTFSRAPARHGKPDAGSPDWKRAEMLLTASDLRIFAV